MPEDDQCCPPSAGENLSGLWVVALMVSKGSHNLKDMTWHILSTVFTNQLMTTLNGLDKATKLLLANYCLQQSF